MRLKISTLKSLIQNSTRLEVLDLNYVTILSSVPNIHSNLTSLQKLPLFHCELHGEFPVGIFHIPNLRVLNLRYNQNLTTILPDFYSSALIKLGLDFISFYGTLSTTMGNLYSLTLLSISWCDFSRSIPSSLSNLTQFTYLNIGYNRFTIETFSPYFANLT